MKIDRREYLVNMHMFIKNDASRSSRLFAVHNGTFREGRTDVLTNERVNERTYDLLANTVKMTLLEQCTNTRKIVTVIKLG